MWSNLLLIQVYSDGLSWVTGLIDTHWLHSVMVDAAYYYSLSNRTTTMHQLLRITGASFHRWQKDAEMAIFFFFFVCRRLFVISHLMLTCKLLRARVTIADDSFVLSPLRLWLLMLWFSKNPLWLQHKWDRGRKHRLENTLKAPVLEPVVSLEAVGDFGQNNCYCSAGSKCVQVQVQIPCLCFHVSN